MEGLEDLGKKLKKIRLQHDLTQDDIADKLAITKSTVSRLENGKIDPSYLQLVEYAEAIGCSFQMRFKCE